MPFKSGSWGVQGRERSIRRREYFKNYAIRNRNHDGIPGLGSLGESLALDLLKNSVKRNTASYDLVWNGKKVEVKTSRPTKNRDGTFRDGYKFNIRLNQKENSDYIVLLCLSHQNYLLDAYCIPSHLLQMTSSSSYFLGIAK